MHCGNCIPAGVRFLSNQFLSTYIKQSKQCSHERKLVSSLIFLELKEIDTFKVPSIFAKYTFTKMFPHHHQNRIATIFEKRYVFMFEGVDYIFGSGEQGRIIKIIYCFSMQSPLSSMHFSYFDFLFRCVPI